MIKAIFFDVANTLLHKPALIPNIQSVFSGHGYSFEANGIQLVHQRLTEKTLFPDTTNKGFYDEFNAELCKSLGIEPTQKIIDAIYSSSSGLSWEKFEDASILNDLSVPIGIGSNWDSSLRRKLEHYFDVHFKWILVSEELGIKKPQPAFFSKMIEISGYDANEIMFVGDSMKLDIVPAKGMGIQAILIDRTNYYSSYDGKKVNSLNEILKWT